jgi:uncharacterized sporulation protein YeaH/YhbH (DUF444 family)
VSEPSDSRRLPQPSRVSAEIPWYELFSRGARDWLRHNQKVRDSVKSRLPDLLSGPDLLTRPQDRSVLVPIRMLEHARFRLRDAEVHLGAGQGQGRAGDTLREARWSGRDPGQGGGSEDGEYQFVLEMKIDDILDWLWEELKLPELKPRRGSSLENPEYVREGWDKRGPRSRLDRRRTLKEAVKRRAVQEDAASFSNDDLRFRQLVKRAAPALNAVVMFALDVSGSMDEAQRKLAKMFFFFALHGIRRQYANVDMVFVAHTVDAWEFPEEEFFQVSGDGGTHASSAFRLCSEILGSRYDPARYNAYLFYASDGENASADREPAASSLTELAAALNYAGYIETGTDGRRMVATEISGLFTELRQRGFAAAAMPVITQDDVWKAIRHFFNDQQQAAA